MEYTDRRNSIIMIVTRAINSPLEFEIPNLIDPLFKITIDTTKAGSASNTFVLPLQTTSNNFVINWGDGNLETVTTVTSISHTYASSGSYQISLDGSFSGIKFNNAGDKLKLSSIDNWGTNQILNLANAFYGCVNMVGTYTDSPDTSLVTNMSGAFRGCTNLNSPINFNTSSLNNISIMFRDCSNFNSTIIFSDTSLVGDMSRCFLNCNNFNQPINFNTSSVGTMLNMFYGCTNFDQDISSFNISSLTNAGSMLYLTAFSKTNYDLLLPAWDAYGTSSVVFHAGTAHYSAGAPTTAHNAMVSRGWTITDGGTP